MADTNTRTPAATPKGTPDAGTLDTAKQKASEIAQAAKESLTEAATVTSEKVREQTEAQIDAQKGRAAQGLVGVADALKQTSATLREQEQQAIPPEYVETAAEQIRNAAEYLEKTDAREMIHQVESFARRQPLLFLGGAFGAGLVLARFLRSSGRKRRARKVSTNNTPVKEKRS
jgi:hypothetical protein